MRAATVEIGLRESRGFQQLMALAADVPQLPLELVDRLLGLGNADFVLREVDDVGGPAAGAKHAWLELDLSDGARELLAAALACKGQHV
jgi:hypothetical protein